MDLLRNHRLFLLFLCVAAGLALLPSTAPYAVGLSLIVGAAVSNLAPDAAPPGLGKMRKLALNTAVVLFGFGLNIRQVIVVGGQGVWQTAVVLALIISLGFFLLRFFRLQPATLELIVFGTSICGGSAIAAVSSVTKASDEQIGVAMGVVFVLNAVALAAFPLLAAFTPLTPEQYGVWCALSIHDTSSVVAAAAMQGTSSLQTATITKLIRTLWITPLVFAISLRQGEKGKLSLPLFVVFFLLASLTASFLPFAPLFKALASAGKALMAVALYIVGFGLHYSVVKKGGAQGMLFGALLWSVSIVVGYLLASMS